MKLFLIPLFMMVMLSIAIPALLVVTIPFAVLLVLAHRHNKREAARLEGHYWGELTNAAHARSARSITSTWGAK